MFRTGHTRYVNKTAVPGSMQCVSISLLTFKLGKKNDKWLDEVYFLPSPHETERKPNQISSGLTQDITLFLALLPVLSVT